MPGMTGIEVARRLLAHVRVVFETAFDHYDVQAFEANAIDYVLKPVETIRLAQAVGRDQADASGRVRYKPSRCVVPAVEATAHACHAGMAASVERLAGPDGAY